jgi:hypothetical protein
VEVLLADSVSELAAHLAELQEPAGLGRLRHLDLPDVSARSSTSADSRHRGPARPGTNPIKKRLLAVMSLGWRNSEPEWRHFARMYLFLAAFSTPLVLSVHSVVSFDFAMASRRLARHDLPALLRRRRHLLGYRDGLHDHHPDPEVLPAAAHRHDQPPRRGGQARLFTSMVVGCAYLIEFWVAWYSATSSSRRISGTACSAVVVGRVDHAHLQHDLPAVAVLADAAPEPTWLFILPS